MKKFLALLLLVAIASFALADVYTIGDGTSTQNYVPTYGFYDYSWSKTIYTAAEINAAGLTTAENLVGIGFDVGNTPANYLMLDQRVYIRTTTASIYEAADNTLPDNTLFTQVYQGDYTFNGGGWHYVMFSTPYAWDGTSNIEILWENWDGDYLTGYPNFRYTTTTPEYRTVYKYADNDFPGAATGTLYYNRPNIQFVTPQLDPPNPAVAIYPTAGGYAFTDAALSWQSGGGMPTGYNVYLDTVNPPVAMVSTAQPSTSYAPAALLPATTYYWQIVPVNANGPAADCPVWSFMTPGAEQLAESFNETTWPPPGWANLGSFTRSTTTPFHGAASAYKLAPVTPALLSTPMVSITTGSELNFWARTSSTAGNGRIQIQYSPDRENWTNVGDPIALPTVTTWNNYVVDLSSLAGNNYYLAFANSSVTSTTATYVDHVFGPNITPLMPGPVTLNAPADAAINQSVFPNLTWTAGTTGGVATSYKVYLDTNPNPTTMIATVPGMNYTLETALTYLTTYYWKVVANNSAGDSEASAVFSFTTMDNPTISTFPWTVDFGTQTADWPVLNWTQLNGLYPTPTGTSAQWFQDDWLNNTAEANKAAKINIYGTLRYGWLVTPPIAIPADGYQLKFDAALMVWNGTTPPTGTQPDDKFIVAMSDTPNMANPVILREWNNVDSPYVFDSIPHTGENVIIPLTGVTGTKYFAFYGESTISNGDNDLMVDNVYIGLPQVDPPAFAVTPESHNFGEVDLNTTANQVFTISNIGGGELGIASITIAGSPMFALANLPTLPATVTTTPITFGVNFTPTAAGAQAATVTITDNLTRVAHTVQLSGTGNITEELNPPQNLAATVTGDDVHLAWLAPGTPPAQFTEDFESYANFATTFAPWTLVDVDQSTTYGFSGITFPNSGTAMSYIIFNPSATTPAVTEADAHSGDKYAACFASITPPNNDWMISPLVTPQTGDFLSFWARSYVSTYGLERFKVGISTGGTTPADFTIISGTNYVQAPVAWTQYTYDLSAYVGQNIRFAIQCLSNDAFIFFVDDVAVGAVPVRMEAPVEVASEKTNGIRSIVAPNPVEIAETRTETRALLGYKVYRGGTLLNTISNPATLAYDDNNLNPGTYSYTVSAYYDSGESVPAGPVEATIAGPTFSITPDAHNFGSVVIGQTASQTFTVTNTGYGNLIINSITIAGSPMMSLSGLPTLPATLANGATFTFNAAFAPTAAGVQTATVTLVSNLTPANYTVSLTGTGTQGEELLPPLDLAATVETNDVSLTWTSPVPPLTGEWISWSNDVLGNSIGTNSAGTFDVAQRWTQADLAPYLGGQVAMVKFVPCFAECIYTLKVWTGGTSLTDPGTLVYSQVIDPFIEDDWNLVILDNPIPIPTTGELRIGYNVNTQGGYPAGCDSGPVIEGKGNAMYFNNAWTTLTALAPTLTYNWLIQGFVADGPALKAIDPPAPIVETPVKHVNTGILALEQTDQSTRVDRALLGYKVYRDGILLSSINDPAITTYADNDLPNDEYLYGVTAVYSSGESDPTTLNVIVNYELPPLTFGDDFEAHPDFALTFAPWTLLDVDLSATYGIQDITFPNSESPMAFIIFNPSATTPPVTGLEAFSGDKMAASFASTSAVNNDWMITPRLRLGTNSTLRFYAKSHTAQYGLERFRVGISTLANIVPQGFQYITGGTYVEAPINWTEYTYDLSNYDGQMVYVGIRCVSDDAFVFYVDDFGVHSVGGSSNDDPVVPVAMNELKGNYPNPFNPETTIRYSVKETTPIVIEIYNVRGQLVKTLINDTKAAGDHTVVWKGVDENNKPVPSGVYFYKMNAGKYSSTKKMIMMK